MTKMKYYAVGVFVVFMMNSSLLHAQTGTMLYSSGVPQSYYLNPATQPGCSVFVGVPIVSSTFVEVGNSAFAVNNLFYNDTQSDSVLNPLHSPADLNKFLNNFKKANYLSGNFAFNVLSFGFRVKDMYFTFDLTEKLNNEISYSKDLIELLAVGNTDHQVFDLSTTGIHINEYMEMAVGISKRFNDMLSVGIRPKLLLGQAIMNTTNEDITLNTSHDRWVLNSKFDMNICIPGVYLPVDNGKVDLTKEMKFDSTLSSLSDYRKLVTGNKGLGIDIGVHVNPIPQLQFSASVLDLSYIKWKYYTNTLSQDGSYSFDGFKVSAKDTSDFALNILDSLKKSLTPTATQASFVSHLYPKVIVGGRFFLLPGFDLGAVSRIDFKETIDPHVYLVANWRPSTALGISASYGLFTGSPTTFGLGLSFRLGPLSTYILSDTYPTTYDKIKNTGAIIPNNVRQFSIRFGVNVLIGANYVKKLMKDKPMYYSDEY